MKRRPTRREKLEAAQSRVDPLLTKLKAAHASNTHEAVLEAVEECYHLQIELYGAQHATE